MSDLAWKHLGVPREGRRTWPGGGGTSGLLRLAWCLHDPDLDQQSKMDAWMDAKLLLTHISYHFHVSLLCWNEF